MLIVSAPDFNRAIAGLVAETWAYLPTDVQEAGAGQANDYVALHLSTALSQLLPDPTADTWVTVPYVMLIADMMVHSAYFYQTLETKDSVLIKFNIVRALLQFLPMSDRAFDAVRCHNGLFSSAYLRSLLFAN